ncbi:MULTISPECIES: SIS domain-containing protein [Brucella/Ochrobactrum group]|uniref:SIS domain-containing protein n=1 Tax=Brucella/Ochrobactrum group TaxID=2826938 RepID=UPI001C04F1DB|nr:SIS domain-containing protein [Brucella sp. NBRC 12950]QWK79280.1 SIS domain-containing protein [Ochrobactrum sp. BTU1]GLU25380.1 glucosamine--fructose-6-phosphate aminotransferase [Brucella sp. NBRC 12950]
MATPSFMRQETIEASSVVSRLLREEAATFAEIKRIYQQRTPRVITTAARGSSDHAASFFKYLFEISVGIPVASIGPSITSVYNGRLRLEGGLHFTVSQSGASPDIVALQKAAKKGGAITVAVVNVIDSPLAREADIVLNLRAGQEQSVAATKSCIAGATALAAVTAAIAEAPPLQHALTRLPEALEQTTNATIDSSLASRLSAINGMYVVGRGTGFAVALEAALKAKETCGIHAEAFSLAEVMHGPIRLVHGNFPVIAFLNQDEAYNANRQAIDRLIGLGADVVTIGEGIIAGKTIHTASTGNGLVDPLVGLGAYYRFIEYVAQARGLNPDAPKNLRKVTETV